MLRMFVPSKPFKLSAMLTLELMGLERLARDKHSSLLGPFVSYEEIEVL
jgi:hypothetical protein